MDIVNVGGFTDLNIDPSISVSSLERLINFNYRIIALNHVVDESASSASSSQKNKKNLLNRVPETIPTPRNFSEKHQDIIRASKKKMKVLHRLTVVYSKPDQLRRILSSPLQRKYDIFALLPTTQAAFQHACNLNNVDIISFQFGVTQYKPNRKLYRQVLERGGYFEIPYIHLLSSSASRQETITMAQFFYIYGKSKNLIISSGASNESEIRNPYDVANLVLLFGLSVEQGKYALSSQCRQLVLKAVGRRLSKTAIAVEVDESGTEQRDGPKNKKRKIDPFMVNLSELEDGISTLASS